MGSADTAPPLRFAVLGRLRAWRGADDLELGSPQQQAVLAALLLHEGRATTAQELISALWGERSPARAVGTLRTYGFRLRRLLEPDRDARTPPRILVTVADGYALRVPAASLDLTVFEERVAGAERAAAAGDPGQARELLRSALGLWQGEPLAGLPGPYAQAQRTRLAERRLAVLERRLELDLRLGGHAAATAELTALTARHPLREGLRGLLMIALYGSGRQTEALAAYDDTRRTLVGELGIEPGHELAEIHRRILEGDPALLPQSTTTAPAGRAPEAPVPLSRPAQLPGDVADFTGRDHLVVALREAMLSRQGQAVVIAAVAGAGGVGKTALALHVAHQVRDGFPDGQLYVDLRGAGRRPAEPQSVLGGFLRALGVEDSAIPDGLTERATLFRTTLADRRVLVLLDNARDAEQLRPLLPGAPTCAVLVTSRGKLAGLSPARLFDLDVLEPAEAAALFTRIAGAERAGAEPGAVADLVAACGWLPLAVRIVAARLSARPGWSVRSLVDRLADKRRRLAELRVADLAVEAVFQLGYNQLDDRQRRAFRLLALPDGPSIALPAAAAVLGLDEHETEDLCESLVDASMLRSPVVGRYRFHDLLKLYARERAEQDEDDQARTRALHRLLGFYLATARTAHRLADPGDGRTHGVLAPAASPGLGFDGPDAGRDWLFTEAPVLFAAVIQGAAGPAIALQRAADLLLMLDGLVESGFHGRDCERAAYAVIDQAWERRDLRSEGRAHLQLGWIYYYADRFEDAAAVCRVALQRGRETRDDWVICAALGRLAACAHMARRYAEVVGHSTEGLEVSRRCGDRYSEANLLAGLARGHLGLGLHAEAVTAAEECLAIHRGLGGTKRVAFALYQLGIVLRGVGRADKALATLAESRDIFRARQTGLWEGLTMFRSAETLLDLKRYSDAVHQAEEALAVLVEVRDAWAQANTLNVLGHALTGLGKPDQARVRWQEARDIFDRLGLPDTADMEALLNQ